MLGEVLGHYRIVKKIGSGGMGEVYRARDDQLDRDVALKILPSGALPDEATRKRFRQEALILAKLNHPNIATIHEFGSQEGVDFLVMELIPGKSLREIISQGPMAEKQIQRLGIQLADGLATAHRHNIVHRDLKPANIMVTSDGRLKILDFGLAKLVQDACPDVTLSSTKGDAVPGTLPYMAPEQVKGDPVDVRTDIYATGAVLYEMSTGQRPFVEANSARLLESILHKSPRPPRELNRRLSFAVQAIILKALEKLPEDRHHSIEEIRLELERLAASSGGQSSVAPEQSELAPLEMGYVLSIDLPQYSSLPMDEQRLRLRELHRIARNTAEFVHASSVDQLIPLQSGDGMTLVFSEDPESPMRCAVEVSRAIRTRSEIKLRMGVHSGPIYHVSGTNEPKAVAGAGVDLAQRVMDCGEPGHILVSQSVADVLGQLSNWSSAFHDLGEVEVQRGVYFHLFNFYMGGIGNPEPPKLKAVNTPTVAEAQQQMVPRSASGASQEIREEQKILTAGETDSTQSHSVQITVPEVPRWAWLSLVGSILIVGVLTLSAPLRQSMIDLFSHGAIPPTGIPSLQEGKHVIVLPFDVQGDRDTLGFVSEGLEEELSRRLSALPTLHVVSASSVKEQAKQQKVDLHGPVENIGRNFGVNLIVHGTIQQSGGWVRIDVDFDDVANARRLLNVPFSYPAAAMSLLDVEDQVHTSILKVLKLKPNVQERTRAASPTSNKDAYDHYLQGRYITSLHADGSGIRTAIELYERAIQKDSRFALAYVGLSDACRSMYRQTNEPAWVHKALENAQRAQKLNDALPEVHLALGDAFRQLGESGQAVAEFNRAKDLSPNSDLPWLRLGLAYEDSGQHDEAIEAYVKATQLDPYSLVDRNELGGAYFNYGEYEKALAQFHRVTELDPRNYYGYMNIGAVHLARGKYEESIEDSKKALEVAGDDAPDDADIHSNLGTAYFYLKRYGDSVRENEKAVKIRANDYVLVGNLADAYRWSEKRKKAAETYEAAIELASKQLELNPRSTDALGSLALSYAKIGNLARAAECVRKARLIDPSRPELIFYEATVRVIAKQQSPAMDSLRLALEKGYPPQLMELDPEFGKLHANPEFERLLREHSRKSN
jgi:serine/threonine protein kinase/tetratricopeptide (TPR) repeat protein/TolB-like protein